MQASQRSTVQLSIWIEMLDFAFREREREREHVDGHHVWSDSMSMPRFTTPNSGRYIFLTESDDMLPKCLLPKLS